MRAGAHRALLVILTLAVAALAITSVRDDTATRDEGAHIAAGVVKLRAGWLAFYPGQVPLMNVISVLPAGNPRMPAWSEIVEERNHWTVGRLMLYEAGNDARRLLFRARMPTVALLLALCLAVYLVVRAEAGAGWGLIGFALTGFCPTLLAHGRLATVDVGATAFLFIAFALLLRTLRKPSIAMGVVTGIVAMAAVLSKTSALLVVPFFAVVIALHLWRTRTSWRALVLPMAAALIAAIATLYAVILGLASDHYLQAAFPATPRILVPWIEYARAVEEIRFWVRTGHEAPQFLLGEFSRSGWWYYFLVAFLLKTPLAALLLLLLALVAAVRVRSPAADACWIWIVMFLAVASTSRINLGVRYILPIFPFLYTAVAIVLARVAEEKRRALGVGVLVAWHCLASLIAWPGYLSYFNELIGSHRNADRFLIDSNLDWGQDLHRLRRWAEANGVRFLYVHYFGGGNVPYEFGRGARQVVLPGPKPLPKGSWLAVSRHAYRSSFDPQHSRVDYDAYLAVSKARYVTTVGGSIDVYRVD